MSARPLPRVLVVEDDPTTAGLVALYLGHDGFDVTVEGDGDRAVELLRTQPFDLLVLDVMLPGTDGLELCRLARAGPHPPGVILVTARSTEADRIGGLELGADDYVTKPFSPRELVARARAVLRRVPAGQDDTLRAGGLTLDRERRVVTEGEREVALTPSEYALLEALMRRPGHVRSRAQLLDALPGERAGTVERTVDVHVRNLRRKLERDPARPRFVQTVQGAGYRFAPGTAPR